ncbi:MAG: NUDIX domain-containing protein [Coprobacillus sp.]
MVKFYEYINDDLLEFAVIIAMYKGKYVFCKHKDRETYEIPGGHREAHEDIIETAKRELYEETGAILYSIKPICMYSVLEESFGMLYYADIEEFELELHYEIENIIITNEFPIHWTYPTIQPQLIKHFIGVKNNKTKKQLMNSIEKIKTPDDIMSFMDKYIEYGWIDKNEDLHFYNMKGFRKLYKTISLDMILEYRIGVCIEQVYLMHYLFNKINIRNKMFCCRIYEPNDFNDLNTDEHMHCFILYYMNDKVYHIEHPNGDRKGIYEYSSEQEAVSFIENYYVNFRGGIKSPTTEFFDVESNLTFQEFNNYINSLPIYKG